MRISVMERARSTISRQDVSWRWVWTPHNVMLISTTCLFSRGHACTVDQLEAVNCCPVAWVLMLTVLVHCCISLERCINVPYWPAVQWHASPLSVVQWCPWMTAAPTHHWACNVKEKHERVSEIWRGVPETELNCNEQCSAVWMLMFRGHRALKHYGMIGVSCILLGKHLIVKWNDMCSCRPQM